MNKYNVMQQNYVLSIFKENQKIHEKSIKFIIAIFYILMRKFMETYEDFSSFSDKEFCKIT